MQILILTLIISFCLALAALIGFIWAVRSGQYDDAYTPALRILQDDVPVKKTTDKVKMTSNNGDNINAG